MSERTLAAAKDYVEKSLEAQAALGYSRPPEPVIERVVADVARAISKLRNLVA